MGGPFKRNSCGDIVGPVPVVSIPGLPDVVAVDVELLNHVFQLGRVAGKLEAERLHRLQKSRVESVIADVELDAEPVPDFAAMRKRDA